MNDFLVWLVGVLNANFTIAFIGGFAGAIGGALGAQHIAERARRRDEMAKELRNTNASIMVAFQICSSTLALKHQHVQPMWQAFERQKAELVEFKRRRRSGEIPSNTEFILEADFKVFPAPLVPIETLKKLVFEQVSTYGRPLALVAVLEQSIEGLREAVQKRDALIHRFSTTIPKELFANYYFGLKLPSGDTNQEHPDSVDVIQSYVDDVSFFSSLLCADLIAHGKLIRQQLLKFWKKGVPNVSSADFSGPRAKGLLPPDAQYADWLNGFRTSEDKPRR